MSAGAGRAETRPRRVARLRQPPGRARASEGLAASPPARESWSGSEQLDELMRILQPKPQQFRLQYFGASGCQDPDVANEIEIVAEDASEAIRASASKPWPVGAIGLRIVDIDGHEVFERLKADLT